MRVALFNARLRGRVGSHDAVSSSGNDFLGALCGEIERGGVTGYIGARGLSRAKDVLLLVSQGPLVSWDGKALVAASRTYVTVRLRMQHLGLELIGMFAKYW